MQPGRNKSFDEEFDSPDSWRLATTDAKVEDVRKQN
jgi:hypothetical protein